MRSSPRYLHLSPWDKEEVRSVLIQPKPMSFFIALHVYENEGYKYWGCGSEAYAYCQSLFNEYPELVDIFEFVLDEVSCEPYQMIGCFSSPYQVVGGIDF